jgi:sec-independent protein translocase protein TatC
MPAHHQQFIYTSPGGGINFLFQVCTYAGILFSIPVIIRQLLKFLEPVVSGHIRSMIARYSYVSALLAVAGVLFGYYVGLPLALHFLGNQFTTPQIHALFTIQEYMSFVTVYLVGSALIFQLPVIIMFINHINPISPRRLIKLERYVIVISFITAMIMAPTTNVMNQLVIAGPIIGIYQLSIVMVWWQNRYLRLPKKAKFLLARDAEIQAERHKKLELALPL